MLWRHAPIVRIKATWCSDQLPCGLLPISLALLQQVFLPYSRRVMNPTRCGLVLFSHRYYFFAILPPTFLIHPGIQSLEQCLSKMQIDEL